MGLFDKLKAGLSKTRNELGGKLDKVFAAFTRVDEELLEELEETLILCDCGALVSVKLIDELRQAIKLERITTTAEVKKKLAAIMLAELSFKAPEEKYPRVILIVGVNGVGKTTTIGKLAKLYKESGKSVLLAAADTFRAAAGEQLGVWAERAGVPIIKCGEGHDPAAVVYDALDSARHRGSDVVLCDTAGRLHNKKNLMNELSKINRVIDKCYPEAERETLLVLDATTGQNAITQVREFAGISEITGIVLTKLDGTAKGGVVLAIRQELGVPVKYIGVGEGIDDLQPFNPEDFVRALIDG